MSENPLLEYAWGILGAPIGFLYQKIYSFNGFKKQTETRLKNIEESKTKVWEQINCIRNDITEIKENVAFLRGKFDQ